MSGSESNVGNVEAQLVSLLEKLEEREPRHGPWPPRKMTMLTEVRTLELWRAVIAECLATVFYVFLVCGSYSPWMGRIITHEPEARLVVSFVSGFAIAVLIHSFGQVSGGHINPAVSVGFAITRRISFLRASMFILAQLGGGIAGAALLYGVTSSGYSGNLGATEVSGAISVWQGFGLEFLLTLMVVFIVFSAYTPYKRSHLTAAGSPAVVTGLAYLASTLVGFPLTGASMNPARSLGPAFVMNKWNSHWVYWVAPLLGGITAALIYEYIFNPRRTGRLRKESVEAESSSVASEEDAYDECSKPPPRYNYKALRPQNYDQYRPPSTNPHSPAGYTTGMYGFSGAASLINPSSYKLDSGYTKEEIYSGSRSMYTKSPPLPRKTTLNRSQSVYTRPSPPRTDNYYYRNITQHIGPKSPGSFTGLLQQPQHEEPSTYLSSNPHQDSLYVTNKAGLVKPEPVYGITGSGYPKQTDSGDSTYSTYRGSGSYSSSRSSGGGNGGHPPVPAVRSHRSESHTPNSIIMTRSILNTPNSSSSYHSPMVQY